jgi:hypothetical protein
MLSKQEALAVFSLQGKIASNPNGKVHVTEAEMDALCTMANRVKHNLSPAELAFCEQMGVIGKQNG